MHCISFNICNGGRLSYRDTPTRTISSGCVNGCGLTRVNSPAVSMALSISFIRSRLFTHLQLTNLSAVSKVLASSIHLADSSRSPPCYCPGNKWAESPMATPVNEVVFTFRILLFIMYSSMWVGVWSMALFIYSKAVVVLCNMS